MQFFIKLSIIFFSSRQAYSLENLRHYIRKCYAPTPTPYSTTSSQKNSFNYIILVYITSELQLWQVSFNSLMKVKVSNSSLSKTPNMIYGGGDDDKSWYICSVTVFSKENIVYDTPNINGMHRTFVRCYEFPPASNFTALTKLNLRPNKWKWETVV